jgi:hypothetical protein
MASKASTHELPSQGIVKVTVFKTEVTTPGAKTVTRYRARMKNWDVGGDTEEEAKASLLKQLWAKEEQTSWVPS